MCESVVLRKCLNSETCFVFLWLFFVQTVAVSGYYGIETFYRIHIIKKLDLFFNSLSVRS